MIYIEGCRVLDGGQPPGTADEHEWGTVYSKIHVDNVMQARQPDPEITEWYTLEEIVERYNLKAPYVSNLIFRNAIPKTRHGNKGYYSKKHFDTLMEAKFPKPEYYTVEEATARFGISRDVLYQHIKRHNIPHEKDGRYIRVSKTHFKPIIWKPIKSINHGNKSNITPQTDHTRT